MSEYILVLSNVLIMSKAIVIVCSVGLSWLKPDAMVLFLLCSPVIVK